MEFWHEERPMTVEEWRRLLKKMREHEPHIDNVIQTEPGHEWIEEEEQENDDGS